MSWCSKPRFSFASEITNRCLCLDCGSSLNTGLSISLLPSSLFKGPEGPSPELPPASAAPSAWASREGGPWERKGVGPLIRRAFWAGLHGLEKAPLLSCLWGPSLPAEVLERQRGGSACQLGAHTACCSVNSAPTFPSTSPPSVGPLAAEPLE